MKSKIFLTNKPILKTLTKQTTKTQENKNQLLNVSNCKWPKYPDVKTAITHHTVPIKTGNAATVFIHLLQYQHVPTQPHVSPTCWKFYTYSSSPLCLKLKALHSSDIFLFCVVGNLHACKKVLPWIISLLTRFSRFHLIQYQKKTKLKFSRSNPRCIHVHIHAAYRWKKTSAAFPSLLKRRHTFH
jgi:hypothetical protein